MKLLTSSLVLAALVLLHAPISMGVVDSYEKNEVYNVPDFPHYELKLPDAIPLPPEEEWETAPQGQDHRAPAGCARTTGTASLETDPPFG